MKKYSFMFNFKLFMYCRISQRWLFSSVIDIEMGNSTIQDVCKCVDMVDSIPIIFFQHFSKVFPMFQWKHH